MSGWIPFRVCRSAPIGRWAPLFQGRCKRGKDYKRGRDYENGNPYEVETMSEFESEAEPDVRVLDQVTDTSGGESD